MPHRPHLLVVRREADRARRRAWRAIVQAELCVLDADAPEVRAALSELRRRYHASEGTVESYQALEQQALEVSRRFSPPGCCT